MAEEQFIHVRCPKCGVEEEAWWTPDGKQEWKCPECGQSLSLLSIAALLAMGEEELAEFKRLLGRAHEILLELGPEAMSVPPYITAPNTAAVKLFSRPERHALRWIVRYLVGYTAIHIVERIFTLGYRFAFWVLGDIWWQEGSSATST